MSDETVVNRTEAEIINDIENLNASGFGFGFVFGDKTVYYTGRAGRGFLNDDPTTAYTKYSKEGAFKKVLDFVEKYSDTFLASMTGIVLVKAD